jgi:hypothetical protein
MNWSKMTNKDDADRFIRTFHGQTGSRWITACRLALKTMKNSCLAGLAT